MRQPCFSAGTLLRDRLRVPCALALVAVLAACDSGPTLPGGVARAALTITVDPSPVPGRASSSLGFSTISYKIVITEMAGLGGEFVFVNSTVFDETSGRSVGVNNYDGADLIVFVGSKRLDARQSLEVSQQIDYALPQDSAGARLVVAVQFRDDRGNVLNQSLLVKVE